MNTNFTLTSAKYFHVRLYGRKILFWFFLLLAAGATPCAAQINAYASVTSISGTTLSVSNVNQTYHTFNNGDQIIIMQMQDNVIGLNTTNLLSFGNIVSIANAGYYEVATISSVAGLPTSVTITAPISGTFNFNSSSSVQIISFRKYGSPNYTTTAAITALAWNGKIGGVVAFQVPGTLTVAYPIDANGKGFRGGSVSASYEVSCEPSVYASSSSNYATKGEGIHLNSTGLTTGRASIGNGGGGGSDDNGGGGGGGNYSAGGLGGFGWTCSATPTGGLGGLALSTYITGLRVFMGGGGGGGQQNNGVGSAGGNGGGIVLISANSITTSCSGSLTISANGSNPASSGNDGAGGAGAAGSIIMSIKTFNVPSGCPLTVQGNGGTGGSVTDPNAHGGGGGGAQGVVIYPSAIPVTNITTVTTAGNGGVNSSAAGSTTAGSGSGTSNSGVLANSGMYLLAMQLETFDAAVSGSDVLVSWTTSTEINNDHFTLERSTDGTNFSPVAVIRAAGNSQTKQNYNYVDVTPPSGKQLYRLQQTGVDGISSFSRTVEVFIATVGKEIRVFPNPATDQFTVQLPGAQDQSYQLSVFDLSGKSVMTTNAKTVNGQINVIPARKLAPGVYVIRIGGYSMQRSAKLVIR